MFYSSLRFSQNGSEQEAGGCEVSYGGWALGGQAWWKWNNKVDQCPSKDWRDSSAWWNSCMYLCSPSQNSVPLHLARHAVASTDGMFFEGKPHSRAKGTPAPPPPQLCREVAIWLRECNACLGKACVPVGHVVATENRYMPHALREPGVGMDGCLGNETWVCWFMLCSATRELNQQPVCVS